jgi:hypothetical protein
VDLQNHRVVAIKAMRVFIPYMLEAYVVGYGNRQSLRAQQKKICPNTSSGEALLVAIPLITTSQSPSLHNSK